MTLSAGEIRTLLPSAEGNYLTLKALAAVAERSGYKLSTPNFGAYEAGIRDIERLTRIPLEFAPMEFVAEGVDVLQDRPVFAGDGTLVYTAGRPDTVYLVSMSGAFKALEKRIDGAADRWQTDFVPELSELKSVKDADGETVTPAQLRAEAVQRAADAVSLDEQEAVHLSAMEAAENAQAERRAAQIRSQFLGR